MKRLLLCFEGIAAGICTAGSLSVSNLNFARRAGVFHCVVYTVLNIARYALFGFTFAV